MSDPRTSSSTRAVLEGVPAIGYYRHLCPFPGSLHAWLEYTGDPVDYDLLMGVSGAPFRRTWNRDDGGNIDLMYFAPEPHTRALRALGYGWQEVMWGDRAALVAAIKESIARGCPVIAFGIVGPPEAGLVTGYDRDGDVLLGWSYFQEGFPGRPEKYYEQADWYERADQNGPYAAIIIGERGERQPPREVLASTLAWAIDLERTPLRAGIPDHVCGLTAYEAWASGLEIDADYPPGNEEVLALRTMIMGDQATMLEERRTAARYLRKMAEVAPEAADALRAAADAYDAAANEMPGIWLWGNNMGPEVGRGLADPATRRGIARHVRLAREKEAVAVEYLEQALTALGE